MMNIWCGLRTSSAFFSFCGVGAPFAEGLVVDETGYYFLHPVQFLFLFLNPDGLEATFPVEPRTDVLIILQNQVRIFAERLFAWTSRCVADDELKKIHNGIHFHHLSRRATADLYSHVG